MKTLLSVLWLLVQLVAGAQNTSVRIALMKYGGGGDWYCDPTALPNLIEFCNREIGSNIFPEHAIADIGSQEIFSYPFIHMTGHGNIVLSETDAKNLRKYFEAGGFLHIDDDYGFDLFIRREMKKVFPDQEFQELPFSHPIFSQKFNFPNGLPKVHEHDNKRPQAFGLFIQNRLVCLYTYESDISDGWEDIEVHNDPETIRQKALQMGANIIFFVFNQ
jgi:hypothetical protein